MDEESDSGSVAPSLKRKNPSTATTQHAHIAKEIEAIHNNDNTFKTEPKKAKVSQPLPRGWLKVEWIHQFSNIRPGEENNNSEDDLRSIIDSPNFYNWLKENHYPNLTTTQFRGGIRRLVEQRPGYQTKGMDSNLRKHLEKAIQRLGKRPWGFQHVLQHEHALSELQGKFEQSEVTPYVGVVQHVTAPKLKEKQVLKHQPHIFNDAQPSTAALPSSMISQIVPQANQHYTAFVAHPTSEIAQNPYVHHIPSHHIPPPWINQATPNQMANLMPNVPKVNQPMTTFNQESLMQQHLASHHTNHLLGRAHVLCTPKPNHIQQDFPFAQQQAMQHNQMPVFLVPENNNVPMKSMRGQNIAKPINTIQQPIVLQGQMHPELELQHQLSQTIIEPSFQKQMQNQQSAILKKQHQEYVALQEKANIIPRNFAYSTSLLSTPHGSQFANMQQQQQMTQHQLNQLHIDQSRSKYPAQNHHDLAHSNQPTKHANQGNTTSDDTSKVDSANDMPASVSKDDEKDQSSCSV